MAFHISSGVYWSEIDLTNIIPSVSTTVGAIAGVFRWGPVGQRTLVTDEAGIVSTFGKPTNLNAKTWFTAANFSSYSNGLYIVRAANTSANSTNISNVTLSAVALSNNSATPSNTQLATSVVRTTADYDTKTFDSSVMYVARWPGDIGNSLKVSVCDSANAYQTTVSLTPNSSIDSTLTSLIYVVGSNTATVQVVPSGGGSAVQTGAVVDNVINTVQVGDYLKAGNSSVGYQYMQITSVGSKLTDGGNNSVTLNFGSKFNLSSNVAVTSFDRMWEYFQVVKRAPGTSVWQSQHGNTAASDEIHVVVADEDGQFTGTQGTVLEVWDGLSRSTEAKDESGRSIYYKNVVNGSSRYVWWANDLSTGASANSTAIVNATSVKAATLSLKGGADGRDEDNVSLGTICAAYDLFTSADDVDISLIMQGVAKGGNNGTGLANYIIGNIAEVRKDCMVLVSPEASDVVNAAGLELDNVIAFRNSLTNSSYAVMDSGFKYMYDKYNDVYRWVPLNGDIAGIIARSDNLSDPWYSPGGFNRGVVKNVYKLAWNPGSVAVRDQLYKNDINPIVSFTGQAPVLYGDKTLLGKDSAFNRINVRRLFIVLEKAIARAGSALLFELNDEFTRAQFRGMVEPFLREIQGRRGITDFKVVCDDTNNTSQVIDTNGFVGDVYVKPARSINTIQLNFVAARTGVSFDEIVGSF